MNIFSSHLIFWRKLGGFKHVRRGSFGCFIKQCLPSLVALLFLSACGSQFEPTLVTDEDGRVHRTMHYLDDKRGRNHFPNKIKETGTKLFVFDPKVFAWAAYDETGKRVMTGSASGGQDVCDEDPSKTCRTISGSFKVYQKYGENCRSGEYPVETGGGARMPYCMYFFRGYTIHAAYRVPTYNIGHGCIRVLPSAAKWLNQEFITVGTQVIVMPYEHDLEDGEWSLSKASLVPSYFEVGRRVYS